MDLNRLNRDLKDCERFDKDFPFKIYHTDELNKFTARIRGPKNSIYEKGFFDLDIELTNDYPFSPPKVKFITPVYHPNISSQTGAICLDLLSTKWSPIITFRTLLLSIQTLLSAPEPNDPQDAEVAKQFTTKYSEFRSTAEFWVSAYAPPLQEKDMEMLDEDWVKPYLDMGFDLNQIKSTLIKFNFNNDEVLESLLSSNTN